MDGEVFGNLIEVPSVPDDVYDRWSEEWGALQDAYYKEWNIQHNANTVATQTANREASHADTRRI